MLELADTEATNIAFDRFPAPRMVKCSQGSGLERLLKSKVNPSGSSESSSSYNTTSNSTTKQDFFTDDVSLKVFMEHLIKLAVNG